MATIKILCELQLLDEIKNIISIYSNMSKGNPHYQPNYGDYYQHLEWYEPSAETSLWLENKKRATAQTTYKYRMPINLAAAATVAFMTAYDYKQKRAQEKARDDEIKKQKIAEDARTELMRKQYLELVRQRTRLLLPPGAARDAEPVIEQAAEPVHGPTIEDTTVRPPTTVMPTIIDPSLPKYDVRLPGDYSLYNARFKVNEINEFGKNMKPLVKDMGMPKLLQWIQENHPDHARWFVPMFSSSAGMQDALRQNIPVPEAWLDTLPKTAEKRILELYHPTQKIKAVRKKK